MIMIWYIRRVLSVEWIASLLFVNLALFAQPCAFAQTDDFQYLQPQTLGDYVMAFDKQNRVWGSFRAALVDYQIHSRPPGSTEYDRRLIGYTELGGEVVFHNQISSRLTFESLISRRRTQQAEGGSYSIDDERVYFVPTLDMIFITNKGLELTAGMRFLSEKDYTRHIDMEGEDNAGASTKYGIARLLTRRLAVARRSGNWAGGFSYQLGEEEKRSYEMHAPDTEPLSGEEVYFQPPRVAVFSKFKISNFSNSVEFGFIQSRGHGPKKDDDSSLYTDHFDAKIKSEYEFQERTYGASLTHRTFSYSDNAYMTVDTIPLTTLLFHMRQGNEKNYVFLDVGGGVARDKQSLPEVNASFLGKIGIVAAGFNLSL